MKVCKRCGKDMPPNKHNPNTQKYCNSSCKQADYRDRKNNSVLPIYKEEVGVPIKSRYDSFYEGELE